ncbi:ABC transporter ATP-binding protein [Streptomyces sp. Ru73]|uniref:ATP-binding cassette domain-containing protein n=1 Tax=Streptomyces sp. Ru73 TaxID=2080748 RepID=UPI000CDCF399|nr:ATP-binding cassette domain-containing protein [Streptomyces sp. Ru73]POX36031.1 ABC transporter ATP-binding protein [Streptomyces sp. Ru73]
MTRADQRPPAPAPEPPAAEILNLSVLLPHGAAVRKPGTTPNKPEAEDAGRVPLSEGVPLSESVPPIDSKPLIDGITLRLHPGRITALVGASGSGKTTTGLALLGEYPPGAHVTGEVRVPAGRVGYVPQHPAAALNPARRVGALLRDIARAQVRDLRLPRRDRRTAVTERVLRACAEAQLPDAATLLRRYPHQLSGGQQQRFVLAQALLAGCRVVVADEPTTGQNPLTKRHIAARFAALARQGIAVLLLSHDLDVVHTLADDLHVMHEGRILESGPPHRLRQSPQHSHTQALLTPQLPPPPTPPEPTKLSQSRKLSQPAKPAQLAQLAQLPPSPTLPQPAKSAQPAQLTQPPKLPNPASTSPSTPRPPADGTPLPPLLHIPALTAHHHRTPVLHIPSLTLRAGECLAVVGRSGSGKTTLGRCLAGLHRTYDGEIRLDGTVLPRSLRARTREQLAAVQYVFQDARAAFDEHRPVLDQVARTAVRLRAAPADEALTEARRTLTALGLPDGLVRRRPHQLSGGELQRAALARALLARPRVLICDEITSGLDAVTRRSLLTLLTDLLHTRPDLALILITHDPETAALATHTAPLESAHLTEPVPTPTPT